MGTLHEMPQPETDPADTDNDVRLRGRITSAPVERVLPSGDRIVTFRMSMRRATSPMTTGSRQTADWVDCSVWGGRVLRNAAGWQVDDLVEVEGALRRRFFRHAESTTSLLEVEVLTGRRVERGS